MVMDVIDKINKIALNNYFKRVNFKHHLVPVIERVVEGFSESYKKYGVQQPNALVLSEDWELFYRSQKEEIWSDSVILSFGRLPVGIRPIVPVKGRLKVLSEEQVTLSFSQSISGDVIASITPPKSEVMSCQKNSYVVERWDDPLDVTEKQILKVLKHSLMINAYCKTALFPNKKALKLMAKMEVKDSVLSNGGSRIWCWLMYLVKSVKGVARLYGVGAPK
ncbi:hypothetical protein [Vibrio vulnificus]|uniref:hypothetical protein n=1 Tax=Vibrio vulnificus TaxID=672 RepID=UPI000C7A1BD9|nr:hypothetical protein [Vibrio vulnificus]AUJ35192.1 hypothetical protein BWZ32_09950 [Vibrio vulnificus]EGR0084664.1 hypothetical protein [Vibrio vulnificus]HAS6159172.1 hypothetical protein [Vibrio vulnificus]